MGGEVRAEGRAGERLRRRRRLPSPTAGTRAVGLPGSTVMPAAARTSGRSRARARVLSGRPVPSCAAKRGAIFGAFLQEEVLEAVGHRMWAFTIPKLLRPFLLHRRELLGLLVVRHGRRPPSSSPRPLGRTFDGAWWRPCAFTPSSASAPGPTAPRTSDPDRRSRTRRRRSPADRGGARSAARPSPRGPCHPP